MGKHNRPASGSPEAPSTGASAFVAAQPGPSAPAEDTASSAAPGDAGATPVDSAAGDAPASPSSGSAAPDAGSPGASATLSEDGETLTLASADGSASVEIGPSGITANGIRLSAEGQASADVAKELASEMEKLAAPRVDAVSLADHQDVVRQLEALVAERDATIAELRAALDRAHEAFTALARQEEAPALEALPAKPLPPPPEGKARFVVRGPGSLHDGTRLVSPGEPVDLSLEDARSVREHLEPHPALDLED